MPSWASTLSGAFGLSRGTIMKHRARLRQELERRIREGVFDHDPDLKVRLTQGLIMFDPAMSVETVNGGIDLTRSRMNVSRQNKEVLQFDPAMFVCLKQDGFDGLVFQIRSITPINDLPALEKL